LEIWRAVSGREWDVGRTETVTVTAGHCGTGSGTDAGVWIMGDEEMELQGVDGQVAPK
jgi:hypothetical protein